MNTLLFNALYTNAVVNGAVDFVGHIIWPIMLEMQIFGRKRSIMIGLVLSSISCLVVNIAVEFKSCDDESLNKTIDTLVLVWAYIGKMAIGGAFGSVYQYSAELFPTPVRNNGVSIGSFVGKVFTILTPAIMAMELIETWLPGVVFAVVAAVGAVLVMTMPETRGVPPLQTFEEAQLFYRILESRLTRRKLAF